MWRQAGTEQVALWLSLEGAGEQVGEPGVMQGPRQAWRSGTHQPLVSAPPAWPLAALLFIQTQISQTTITDLGLGMRMSGVVRWSRGPGHRMQSSSHAHAGHSTHSPAWQAGQAEGGPAWSASRRHYRTPRRAQGGWLDMQDDPPAGFVGTWARTWVSFMGSPAGEGPAPPGGPPRQLVPSPFTPAPGGGVVCPDVERSGLRDETEMSIPGPSLSCPQHPTPSRSTQCAQARWARDEGGRCR